MPGSHRMNRRAVLGEDRLVRIGRIGLGCPARARPPACVEYEAVALQNGMRRSLAFAPKPEAPKPPEVSELASATIQLAVGLEEVCYASVFC